MLQGEWQPGSWGLTGRSLLPTVRSHPGEFDYAGRQSAPRDPAWGPPAAPRRGMQKGRCVLTEPGGELHAPSLPTAPAQSLVNRSATTGALTRPKKPGSGDTSGARGRRCAGKSQGYCGKRKPTHKCLVFAQLLGAGRIQHSPQQDSPPPPQSWISPGEACDQNPSASAPALPPAHSAPSGSPPASGGDP